MTISTSFTQLIGCKHPVQNAGMATGSPALAIAVAKAGGLGTYSGAMLSPEQLTQVISNFDTPNDEKYGVNFLIEFLEDIAVVEIAAESVRVVEFFFGDPDKNLIEKVHTGGAIAGWQVGSVDEAKAAVDAGCDFIVAQGVEAGGHVRGTVGLMTLLEEVLNQVKIPVLAAGGIATAQGLANVLTAGAAGVRMGTRFVATPESGYHEDYIQAIVDAGSEDTEYTGKFHVMWPDAPHRVLRSSIKAVDLCSDEIVGQMQIGDQTIDIPRYSVMCPLDTATGNIGAMALYAGQSAGLINDIKPAGIIVEEVSNGAEKILKNMPDNLSSLLL